MDANTGSKKPLLRYYLNTVKMVYKQSNDRRIQLFLDSLSPFNTCIENNYTGFLIVFVPKSPLIQVLQNNKKIAFRIFFRELSTLHTRRLRITRTCKGKRKKFELSGAQRKQPEVRKKRCCRKNILITFTCRNVN